MTNKFLEQNCVPHEIAKSLKEIGFDEECMAFYGRKGDLKEFAYYDSDNKNSELSNDHLYYSGCIGMDKKMQDCTAPLFQQVFDWFDKLDIYGRTKWESIGSDEWVFAYVIKHLPNQFSNAKRRNMHFETIKSFEEGLGTYEGGWHTDKEAQIECIKKMICIFNQTVGNDISHEEYEQNRINQLKTDGLF